MEVGSHFSFLWAYSIQRLTATLELQFTSAHRPFTSRSAKQSKDGCLHYSSSRSLSPSNSPTTIYTVSLRSKSLRNRPSKRQQLQPLSSLSIWPSPDLRKPPSRIWAKCAKLDLRASASSPKSVSRPCFQLFKHARSPARLHQQSKGRSVLVYRNASRVHILSVSHDYKIPRYESSPSCPRSQEDCRRKKALCLSSYLDILAQPGVSIVDDLEPAVRAISSPCGNLGWGQIKIVEQCDDSSDTTAGGSSDGDMVCPFSSSALCVISRLVADTMSKDSRLSNHPLPQRLQPQW